MRFFRRRPARAVQPGSTFRPQLERLEDRTVPSGMGTPQDTMSFLSSPAGQFFQLEVFAQAATGTLNAVTLAQDFVVAEFLGIFLHPGPQGAPGPQGSPGPQGPQGPQGPAGPNTVLTAAVDQFGTLKGGSATAAKQLGTGSYEVTFAQDVHKGVAIASPGASNGGSFTNDAVGTTILPGAGGNNTVDVFFNQAGGVSSNTDFMLIVAL